MKIINEQGCFVQKSDLECIVYNDNNLNNRLYSKMAVMINRLRNYQYVKVVDKEVLDYILSCDIITSYDELNSKSISELTSMIDIISGIKEEIKYCKSADIKNIIEWHKEIKYNAYLLEQYNDMLAKKLNYQTNNLPNIKDANAITISNGVLSATKTLSNKIIVYSNNNGRINKIDKDFCTIAYKILMDRYEELSNDETFNYIIATDNSSIVVEVVQRKELDNSMQIKRTLK